MLTGSLTVYVREPDGSPLAQLAVVTVSLMTNQYFMQLTAKSGSATFDGMRPGRYIVEVMAPGYEKTREDLEFDGTKAIVNISVKAPSPAGEGAAPAAPGPPVLAPKAQKELAKALEALQANKPADAREHLEKAYNLAPGNPDVNFLFGIYSAQTNNWARAKSYWQKAIEMYPKHFYALLSLSEALLRENKAPEGVMYLNRAIEAEPTSWRPHALLAQADFSQGLNDEAVKQAERAIELGHGQAAAAQPLLARALLAQGNKDRALAVLHDYLQERPADLAAKKMLETLRAPDAPPASGVSTALLLPLPTTPFAATTFLPSGWMPSDVDEKMPPIEPGVACPLDDVLRNAGERLVEFVGNVDRFTATESLKHELFNDNGLPSSPEMRTFNYLVSIQEIRPGMLNVEEYRDGTPGDQMFPAGIATKGLPSLVLIFHPLNAGNFEMTCEGLTQWHSGLAWQVHFRQRTDRPSTMRSYRLGNGQSFPVALKGRAWIAADTFQTVRLETDLVAPLPQIHLAADHTAIEYGPVHFQKKGVDMWLPLSAEVYFDWRGRRVHRRHSFSDYLLFSVEDKQKISQPNAEEAPASDSSAAATQQPKL